MLLWHDRPSGRTPPSLSPSLLFVLLSRFISLSFICPLSCEGSWGTSYCVFIWVWVYLYNYSSIPIIVLRFSVVRVNRQSAFSCWAFTKYEKGYLRCGTMKKGRMQSCNGRRRCRQEVHIVESNAKAKQLNTERFDSGR